MNKTFDIKIKEIEYSNYDKLHIEFSGKEVNYVLINTLRRIIIQHIPTYAFDKIEFIKNTSIFNNDILRIRYHNFPIQNIENNTVELYNDILNNTLDDDKITNLTMYVDVKNTTLENMNVTTDDVEFFNKEKKIKSIYKDPLLLIKLKQNEEIKFTANINLNIGKTHIKYSPVTNCIYEEINDNKFILKLYSTKQIEEYEILKRACLVLINKLNLINNQIPKNNKDIEGVLEFKEENHTIGNLLSRLLQDHSNIIYAAYKMEHFLINNVIIQFKTNGAKNINDILNYIIKEEIAKLNYIINLIKKN